MKKNKSLIIILLILVVGVIGLTLAYFTNTANITNEFKSREYGTTVTEEFTSPDNWLPGSTEPKTLTVTNSGQVDEAVRVSYVETWTSKNGDNLSLTQGNNRVAIINWANQNDWTTVTENNKTFYYYNYKLAPTEVTSTLLNSVTFNSAITNTNNCTTSETTTGKQVVCSSTGDGYDGATYKLTFTVETVQYDKYSEAWNTNTSIASMKPMNATSLALKSNPITVTNYTDGNIHQMYTFSHEETEQTPALTDYRYIGNDPYNYIYFNCDELNNQTAETCEVWRIIGVFDVERPDPSDNTRTITERRIKIVRGSALPEAMSWDTRDGLWSGAGVGNWNGAVINTYLNGTYFNNISIASRQLIDVAKFYLGEKQFGDTSPYLGSTEGVYARERGNIVYNQSGDNRPLYWIDEIALLYPSDVYMVYGKNVDNVCYSDPLDCHEFDFNGETGQFDLERNNPGYPNTGWIYNSNILENQTSLIDLWTVSASSVDISSVFAISHIGSLYHPYAYSDYGIRPVLYLSSNVKIIDGDGSINNPYKLGL